SMSTRCIFLASLSIALAALTGCGSDGPTLIPIRGEVLYKGTPLRNVPQGLVKYLPKSDDARQASGRIQPDGSFVLTTFQNADGVTPGEYHVIVTAYTTQQLSREQVEAASGAVGQPRLLIPEKYTDPNTSPLTDVVDSDHSGFKRIELTD
ncbi:MAG TPA: hypothetical protein VJ828_16770, partial [Lacipirellulaceae bacterium]|nr:hypothetical protein [Lacipirellulaceae bacterium]